MPTPLAGERIRDVRHLLNISQGDLANAVGVSQALISGIERGTREATNELLNEIALATVTPRSFFDVIPPESSADSLRFRKLSTAKSSETKQVSILFKEIHRVVVKLTSKHRIPLADLPLATDTELGLGAIESLAEQAREAFLLAPDKPIPHVTRACERAGIPVVPLALPGAESPKETVGHYGMSEWAGGDARPLIGYFAGGPGDRQRFTLSHEIGHLLLHTRRRVVENPEGEAHGFAGAFLLPRERAVEIFDQPLTLTDFARIKSIWGMSISSLIMRGHRLGFIDEQRKVSLFRQLSSRGWRKNEPVAVHAEEPLLVRRLLETHYGAPLPYSRISEEVGLSAVTIRSIAPRVAA